jgi:hypothetical protein
VLIVRHLMIADARKQGSAAPSRERVPRNVFVIDPQLNLDAGACPGIAMLWSRPPIFWQKE